MNRSTAHPIGTDGLVVNLPTFPASSSNKAAGHRWEDEYRHPSPPSHASMMTTLLLCSQTLLALSRQQKQETIDMDALQLTSRRLLGAAES